MEPSDSDHAPSLSPASWGFDHLYTPARRNTGSTGIPFDFPEQLDRSPLGEIHCAVATVDKHGRLSDRSALRLLRWLPGQPISVDVEENNIAVIRRSHDSCISLRSNGYLVLPARIRHSCNLSPGDRVLIAATLTYSMLVVYSTPVLASALWEYRPISWRELS
ncbi:AbrB/MazE/SpoVT family DNA-binding domain-containing protein [Nocardia huaxiensis]|uniref:AbrB/MazE/SpoVT family DNA-binding domain-containing protein n=1 Tax=Nocardia huaxiensis TaxID=2755382 RepID=A0A7D6YZX7_9NOCA|nr:AbrB/MazE/SpoVT family DNA-binding domain-containing protein [Nocardia huaxiensis]QLY28886.1 AbrB/MazE/SpoVT family DNA-binding domain-containing protein [Nocardia huaxiensis]UFS97639.1 AbrB/MazE/SpoVT family DNA-binding domain-containing protein [Nocardia huaxiensis]